MATTMAIDTAIVRRRGVIASYSSTGRPEPVLPCYPLAFKGITLRLVQGFLLSAAEHRSAWERIGKMAGNGSLKVEVGASFPLQEIAEAHQAVEQRAVIGNTVVTL